METQLTLSWSEKRTKESFYQGIAAKTGRKTLYQHFCQLSGLKPLTTALVIKIGMRWMMSVDSKHLVSIADSEN